MTPGDFPEDIPGDLPGDFPSHLPGEAVADSAAPLPPRRLLRGSRNLQSLVGRRLLVGITFVDDAGRLIRREQAFGVVCEVADGVVTLARADAGAADTGDGGDGSGTVLLPADESSFRPAPPGTYRLAGTGEEIVDPDFLTTWTVVVHQS